MATPLLEQIATNAAKTPDKLALAFLGSGPNGGVLEKEMKYQDVMKQTNDLAANLLGKGLVKGDLVVLVYPPSLDFIIAFLACLTVGIVAVPVFPPHPARKDTLLMFSKIVESCNATFALTSASYSHMKKLSSLKDAFSLIIGKSQTPWPTKLTWITTDTLPSPSKKFLRLLNSSTTNNNTTSSTTKLAFLQYTSGSTSEPKGVQITHGNLADNLHKVSSEVGSTSDTIVASWLPQYHDMGLIGSYLGILYCGGTGYYTSPLTFVQRPVIWVEMVSRYGATHLQAPNFAYKLTARKFIKKKYRSSDAPVGNGSTEVLDLSTVRHMINAAEPVTEESIEAFHKMFRPFGLADDVMKPTYGLAEHTVFVCSGGSQRLTVDKQLLEVEGKVVVQSTDAAESASTSRLVGCGYPHKQSVDVRIVDAERCVELGVDTVGEIWIRSESKAAGYYNRLEDSKRDFCALLVEEWEEEKNGGDDTKEDAEDKDVRPLVGGFAAAAYEAMKEHHYSDRTDNKGEEKAPHDPTIGYLRSGDLGFLHNDELFVCGRIKDLIIVGGRNYYPQDLEATAEAAASKSVRPGCSAAFTVDPISGGDQEEVALVLELKEVPASNDIESTCSTLVKNLRSAITKEHSLSLTHLVLLRPRTVKKTSSGKIARAWCRKAFVNDTFADVVVYKQSFFRTNQNDNSSSANVSPLEIEEGGGTSGDGMEVEHGGQLDHVPLSGTVTRNADNSVTPVVGGNSNTPAAVRALDKAILLQRLTFDVTQITNNSETNPTDSALNTFMDSLSISQFKGLLEGKYHTKISDEYLFQERCTLDKVVEVVKLGYAPDDVDQDAPRGVRRQRGVAGALGCPPGVVCSIM